MKKILSIAVAAVLICAMFAPMAVSADPQSFNIPKAASAPTFDGVINADEWEGCLVIEMKKGGANLTCPVGEAADFNGAVFQFMWADEGIYFSCVSTGNNDPFSVPAAEAGSYNAGNGVQFNIYPTRESGGGVAGENFFFSYHPSTDDGKPYVGEHFVYSDGATGLPVPEAKISVVMNGNDYTMEALIPSVGLAKSDPPIKVAQGAVLLWNNVIMFTDDGGAQGLAADAGWFDGNACNAYTLTDTLAGIGSKPAPAEEPAAPAENPPAAAEEPAAGGGSSAPEQPVVTAPAAPPTGDSCAVLIMLAFAFTGALAVYAKRAKNKA